MVGLKKQDSCLKENLNLNLKNSDNSSKSAKIILSKKKKKKNLIQEYNFFVKNIFITLAIFDELTFINKFQKIL